MDFRILTPDDVDRLAPLMLNAFPGYYHDLEKSRATILERFEQPERTRYGAFEGESLLGTFSVIDFSMSIEGTFVDCGGIGGVAVGLEHRKKRCARHMMQYVLELLAGRGTPLSALYPFRTDFYQSLGWAPIVTVRQLEFEPRALPAFRERAGMRPAGSADLAGLEACYEEYARTRTGFMRRPRRVFEELLRHGGRVFCFDGERGIEAYLHLSFRPDKTYRSKMALELLIEEAVYTSSAALRGLLGFLEALNDQVTRIVWHVPMDERLELFLKDPASPRRHKLWHYVNLSGRTGVGFMLRLVDAREALRQKPGYNGVDLSVRLEIDDPQLPRNAEPFTLCVREDRAEIGGEADLTVRTDIGTLAQLYVGYISLRDALWAGKATCSDERQVTRFDAAFQAARSPFTLSFF